MPFDPSKYGAIPVSKFDPSKYGAVPVNNSSQQSTSQTGIGFPTKEPEEVKQGFLQKLASFGLGAAKGAGHTLQTVGDMGSKVLDNTVGKGIDAAIGVDHEREQKRSEAAGQQIKDALEPKNTAEKLGFGTEQVGEFFIPVGGELKAGAETAKALEAGKALDVANEATKVPGLLEKVSGAAKNIVKAPITKEALKNAGITFAQGGEKKDATENAALTYFFHGAGKLVGNSLEKYAPRIVNSLIKPLSKDFEFGKNPGNAIVKEGITANTFDDLVNKLKTKKQEVGTAIGDVLKHPVVEQQQVNLAPAFSPVQDAVDKAIRTGDQKLIDELSHFVSGQTRDFKLVDGKLVDNGQKDLIVSPLKALASKIDVGDSIRWREGIDQELNKVKQKVYRNISSLIEEAVDKARKVDSSIPDVGELNNRYGNLITAESAAKYRKNILDRQNLVSLGGKVIGAGVAGPKLYNDVKQGDITGFMKDLVVGLGISKGADFLGSPAFKTRAAQLAKSLSPEEHKVLSKTFPLLKNLIMSQNNSGK